LSCPGTTDTGRWEEVETLTWSEREGGGGGRAPSAALVGIEKGERKVERKKEGQGVWLEALLSSLLQPQKQWTRPFKSTHSGKTKGRGNWEQIARGSVEDQKGDGRWQGKRSDEGQGQEKKGKAASSRARRFSLAIILGDVLHSMLHSSPPYWTTYVK